MAVLTVSDVELLFVSMLRSRLMETGYVQIQGEEPNLSGAYSEQFPALTEADKCLVCQQVFSLLGVNDAALSEGCQFSVLAQSIRKLCVHAHTLWVEKQDSLFFLTSGSTGEPVVCEQHISLLWQEATYLASLFSGRRRVVAVVPQHHIYGFLFTVLLPRLLGASCLVVPPYPSRGWLQQLKEGDLIIAFPMFWKGLAQLVAENDAECPEGISGVTSTGPCSPDTLLQLDEWGCPVTEIYGSSETGGVGFRRTPDSPYSLFAHWAMQESLLVRFDEKGQELVSLMFPDEVEWESERAFRPLRRKDKAVQVAGRNVYPEKVARILSEHPSVKECAVRLMRQEEGNRLKAFVVPQDQMKNELVLKQELHSWCREQCSVAEHPKKISLGSVLPTNSLGKLADW